jgi:hypothetical protein
MVVTGAFASLVVELSEGLSGSRLRARLYPSRAADNRNLSHVDDVLDRRLVGCGQSLTAGVRSKRQGHLALCNSGPWLLECLHEKADRP